VHSKKQDLDAQFTLPSTSSVKYKLFSNYRKERKPFRI
jgi:hypothetical protein